MIALGHELIADRLVHGFGETAELADIEIDPTHAVGVVLAGDQHHLGLDDPGLGGHVAPGLDDDARQLGPEVLAQGGENPLGDGSDVGHVLAIANREPAAEIDQVQSDAGVLDRREDLGGAGNRRVPLRRIGLLRADVERHPGRLQALTLRLDQQVGGHVQFAAELARQRPVGPLARGQDAAVDLRLWRRGRQLFQLGLGIEGVETDTAGIGTGDVGLLLDRVAVDDARSGCADRQAHLDLVQAGGIEMGTLADQGLQNLAGRIGLHGIGNGRRRQGFADAAVALGDDVEVDDKARRRRALLVEKAFDLGSHDPFIPMESS